MRRPWLIAAPLLLMLVLALAWSGFWYFATGVAERRLDEWRAQEARSGRVFTCASQTIGGFPFRVELRCADAGAEFRNAPQTILKLADIVVVAQVWDPTLLTAEFNGPLTAGDAGKPPSLSATWKLARASVRGTPSKPEHISIVIDGGKLDRIDASVVETLALADRVELHSRLAPESIAGNHAVDVVMRVAAGTVPLAGPFGQEPIDADITAVLRGLKDLRPKPTAVWLRELQASGARLEITNAHLRQGETRAVTAGTLSLSPAGRLDGALRLTVAGVERFLPALIGERGGPALSLERAAPALNAIDRVVRANPVQPKQQGHLVSGLLGLLGERTEIDGRPAVALPLRFSDGKASLGPIPLGQVPALY